MQPERQSEQYTNPFISMSHFTHSKALETLQNYTRVIPECHQVPRDRPTLNSLPSFGKCLGKVAFLHGPVGWVSFVLHHTAVIALDYGGLIEAIIL